MNRRARPAARSLFLVLAMMALTTTAVKVRGQAGPKQLAAEAEQAWAARDFARAEQASRAWLAAVPQSDSPEAVVMLFYLSGAETVAGRVNDAAGHLDEALDTLARLTCRTQIFPYAVAGDIISQTLRDLPPRSRGNLQVMWNKVWLYLMSDKNGNSLFQVNLYRGLGTILAAGLTTLYQLCGASSVALMSYATEAQRAAPPVEMANRPASAETICGCVQVKSRVQFLEATGYRMAYEDYLREMFHACAHPPRAWALLAALSVYMQLNDAERTRRAALELQDLRDRSLTTGSLRNYPALDKQVDTLCDILHKRFPQFWNGQGPTKGLTAAEVESLSTVGETGPPFVTKVKIRDSHLTEWNIILKATLPAETDRTSTDAPWWLYRWEDGRLRIVGRARTWKSSKRPKDSWELRVERLALENLWSTTGFFDKFETERPLELLGPVLCSRELLGYDFEGLPAQRLQLFKEGLPWVGMSERLMRLGMRGCSQAMIEWKKGARDFREPQTIAGDLWKVALRDGRVAAVGQ